MDQDCEHTVTGVPEGPPAHAARPRPGLRWLILLVAAALLGAAAVAVLLHPSDPTTSVPTSARTITVPRP